MLFMDNESLIAEEWERSELRQHDYLDNKNWVRIEVIDDEKSFYEIAEEWNQLVKLAGLPVFVTFELLSAWWKHFGRHPKRDLFIVTIYLDRELIGIAPFYCGKSSLGPLILHRRLHLMGCGVNDNELFGFYDDYGHSDFLDVIAHPGYRHVVAVYLINFLRENHIKADVVRFQHVSDNSFVISEILPRLKEWQQPYHLKQTDECPVLMLPDSLDKYQQQLGSSSRRRRFRKNLKPCGKKYKVEEADSPEMVQKGLDILYTLHQKRWNSNGYPGIFFDDRYFNFLKEISEKAYKKGWLWFKIASDDKGYCAVRWVLNYGNRFFDCTSGFDSSSSSSKYRPGLGLVSLMIKEAIDLKAANVEFLRGTERYKFDFTSKSRYNWRLTFPLNTGKSGLYSFVNTLINAIAVVYYFLCQEWILLRVHFRKAGLLKMFFSYSSFRVRRLSEKIGKPKLFSGSSA